MPVLPPQKGKTTGEKAFGWLSGPRLSAIRAVCCEGAGAGIRLRVAFARVVVNGARLPFRVGQQNFRCLIWGSAGWRGEAGERNEERAEGKQGGGGREAELGEREKAEFI